MILSLTTDFVFVFGWMKEWVSEWVLSFLFSLILHCDSFHRLVGDCWYYGNTFGTCLYRAIEEEWNWILTLSTCIRLHTLCGPFPWWLATLTYINSNTFRTTIWFVSRPKHTNSHFNHKHQISFFFIVAWECRIDNFSGTLHRGQH